jgi:hypothetical protein
MRVISADAWTLPMRAGFDNVTLKQIEHPAAPCDFRVRNPGCGQTP